MNELSIPVHSPPPRESTIADTVVPYARFLEIRLRRELVRMELAKPPVAPPPDDLPHDRPATRDREALADEGCGTRLDVETGGAESRAGRAYERAGAIVVHGAGAPVEVRVGTSGRRAAPALL